MQLRLTCRMLDMLCSREKDTIEMNEDELFKKMEMKNEANMEKLCDLRNKKWEQHSESWVDHVSARWGIGPPQISKKKKILICY